MKKITSIFLVAILYGCGSSVSPVDQGLIDQVMHIGNGSEPQGLDPHVVTGVPEPVSYTHLTLPTTVRV